MSQGRCSFECNLELIDLLTACLVESGQRIIISADAAECSCQIHALLLRVFGFFKFWYSGCVIAQNIKSQTGDKTSRGVIFFEVVVRVVP